MPAMIDNHDKNQNISIGNDKGTINRNKFQQLQSLFQNNILGGYSWTFSHIMPGVVWHNDPTKEYCKNAAQVEQLKTEYSCQHRYQRWEAYNKQHKDRSRNIIKLDP